MNYLGSLRDFLRELDSDSLKEGIWVNPDNTDDFRVSPVKSKVDDGFVFIGSLKHLRVVASDYDCFFNLFIYSGKGKGRLREPYFYNSLYNIQELWYLFRYGEMDKELQIHLENLLEPLVKKEEERILNEFMEVKLPVLLRINK